MPLSSLYIQIAAFFWGLADSTLSFKRRVLPSLHKVKDSTTSFPPAPTALKSGDLPGTLRNALLWQRSRRGSHRMLPTAMTGKKRGFRRQLASWVSVWTNISLLLLSCAFGDIQPLKATFHYSTLKSYFNCLGRWQGQWEGEGNRTNQAKVENGTVLVNSMLICCLNTYILF